MAISTKPELRTQATTDLPDNVSQSITAADVREMVLNFIDANLSYETQAINSTPAVILDETDIVFCEFGADVVTLPLAADYKDRGIIVENRTSNFIDLQAAGADTIGTAFEPNLLLQPDSGVWLLPAPNLNGWGIGVDNRRPISFFAFDEDNPLTTIINTTGVPEIINCTLSQSFVDTSPFLSVSGATVTYSGERDLLFDVTWTFAGHIASGNDRILKFSVVKNESTAPLKLDGYVEMNVSNGKPYSATLQSRIELSTGDTLTCFVSNETNTVNAEITQQQVIIRESR